jgi:hypothetical protein
MKQSKWLILILTMVLGLPTLAGCRPEPVSSHETPFDALARRTPADGEVAFFLDLEPEGEAGRHWERIRQHLEAHPTGQQGLQGLFSEFSFEEYGLDDSIIGPTISGYGFASSAQYLITQISDGNEDTVRDALYQHLWNDATWTQEEYEGQTLYHGRNKHSYEQRESVAWAVYDGLLFLCHNYVESEQSLTQLKELVGLSQKDSLADLPAWQTLHSRLPEAQMGLVFYNLAAQARNQPAAPDSDPLGTAFSQQLEALAVAAVPEKDGMRIEIVGTVALQADPPEFRALFNLPAADPAAWTGLPSSTAFALISHDTSVIWPWLKEMFFSPGSNTANWLTKMPDVVGLDLEADLLSAEGPLTGDFALAITPPLPDQPIVQDLPAGQLLILGKDASEAQMSNVRATMEGRGAIFGPGTVEGVGIQTQAGTELSGYAISYGFDDDLLFFGSSPNIIGQGVAARREGGGPGASETFQSFLEILPDDPTLVVHFNSEPMVSLNQVNMTEEQYQRDDTHRIYEMFEAIGLGLRFAPDGIDGVAYFFVPE